MGFDAAVAANGDAGANGNGNGGGRAFVRGLADGQQVAAAFVVRGRERRQRRDGGEWLQLMLADRTGRVTAKVWEEVDAAFDCCAPGEIVMVEGRYGVHEKYGASLTVKDVRPAAEGEYDRVDLSRWRTPRSIAWRAICAS